MKQFVTNKLLLLCILGANFCFLSTSCAQPQPNCCELNELEKQIDNIEQLREELEEKIKPQARFISIWEKAPPGFKRPSKDPELKKVCDPSIKTKPLQDWAPMKSHLEDLRKMTMEQYFQLSKECEKGADQSGGSMDTSREDDVVINRDTEPREEKEIVDNFNPKDFISDPISYDEKAPFDVIDDVEYGRKSDLKKYICVIYDPKSTEYGVDFLYGAKIDGSWGRIKSFKNAETYLNNSKRSPVMLMNAGIFNPDFKPTGLWYRNGHRSFDFNNKTGLPGNFYMDPGGVFAIKKGGVATILTREELAKNITDTITYQYATQSGPMLVIDGKLHPKFKSRSQNLHTCNGVGILPDGKIVFIISKDEVNFFEFALLFKDGFKCKDALYLDGTISRIYAPAIQRKDPGGNFAGIIAIYKKSSK